MVSRALETQFKSNNFFSSAEIRDDHKQVESGETGNTSEQPETVLKTLAADHQGRLQPGSASKGYILVHSPFGIK